MAPTRLSQNQARRLALHAQQLPAPRRHTSPAPTLSALEQLAYVQIDTISVVQRAHHHTLWNRNPRYVPDDLDRLVAQRLAFEHWSHAAAYLPMSDFRYSLLRKHAIASGAANHWGPRDKRLMQRVLARIREEGPLMAKDFDKEHAKAGDWTQKPAKRALEYLFMQGDLMVSERRNFHKVYDLTERVLPTNVDTSVPSKRDFARFLIRRYLRAQGLGDAAEITYLRQGLKPLVSETLGEMLRDGELIAAQVNGRTLYTLPENLEQLDRPLARNRLSILSPFDNLVIQRERLRWLFDFDYLIECYVPKSKRRYGYFVLPILWRGKLVARMDCKAHRSERRFDVLHLQLEEGFSGDERFAAALARETTAFAAFCDCETVNIQGSTPQGISLAVAAQLT
ncbi:MAG: winged helix DNA-binding domain-containing protein [Congregibacter sp.]